MWSLMAAVEPILVTAGNQALVVSHLLCLGLVLALMFIFSERLPLGDTYFQYLTNDWVFDCMRKDRCFQHENNNDLIW